MNERMNRNKPLCDLPLCFSSTVWIQFLPGTIINPSHQLWALTFKVHSFEWPIKNIVFKSYQPITSLNWRELSTWLHMMTSSCFWNGCKSSIPLFLAGVTATHHLLHPQVNYLETYLGTIPPHNATFVPLSDKSGLNYQRRPLCLY